MARPSWWTAVPSHRLNHQGSCTPQIMENIAGTHHYGVMIKVDGSAWFFRAERPPEPGAGAPAIAAWIAKRQAGTDIDMLFNLGTITGNPLILPVKSVVPDADFPSIDDHFGLGIGVDDQDRPWIAGNAWDGGDAHDSTLRMVRCNVPGGSTTASDWVAVTVASPGQGKIALCGASKGRTYHHFRRLSDFNDDTLIWFQSQRDQDGVSRGREFIAFYLDPGTNNWEPLITTTITDDTLSTGAPASSAEGHFCVANGSVNPSVANYYTTPYNRGYVNGVCVEQVGPTVDRLHVFGLWRSADTNGNSSQHPYYVYCDNPIGNSAGWKTITGASQVMPLHKTNLVPSATIIPANQCQQAAGGIVIDDLGYPHFTFKNGGNGVPPFNADTTIPGYTEALYPDGTAGIMHVWWNGTAWMKEGIPYNVIKRTQGPQMYAVNGDGYMITADGDYKCRLSRAWGQVDVSEGFALGSVQWASEPNPDPVSITKRNQLVLSTPLEDGTPKVYYWGDNAEVRSNPFCNNQDPGPGGTPP